MIRGASARVSLDSHGFWEYGLPNLATYRRATDFTGRKDLTLPHEVMDLIFGDYRRCPASMASVQYGGCISAHILDAIPELVRALLTL
jgi:hypothetical protein